MTSRVDLAYVAVAALALMISGVVAARAATKFCDIYPERCQYSGNGVNYYYPLGYRMPTSTGGPRAMQPPGAALRRTEKRGAGHGVIQTDSRPRTAPFQRVQSAVRAAASSPATLPSTATTNRPLSLAARVDNGRDGKRGSTTRLQ